jgi:hypothetical protein
LVRLVDDSEHAGDGAFMIDGGVPEAALHRIEKLWKSLPKAEQTENRSAVQRRFVCDSEVHAYPFNSILA